jgi:alkylated DNA nucleotide flippase Atl1
MSVASTRAQAIAHILWELKKAEKLASLTSIATRVGFSPGANGRAVITSLKTVRRDWPQLQWWRAVADDGKVDEEQNSYLSEAGFESEPVEDGIFAIQSLATQLMTWEDSSKVDD